MPSSRKEDIEIPHGREPFARLQLEPGLFGVTKVAWRSWRIRSWLSWTLAAIFLVVALAVAYFTAGSLFGEPTWHRVTRVATTICWLSIVVLRLILEGTVSRTPTGQPPKWDQKLVDPWWTSIHTLTGIVLGLWYIPLITTVSLTVLWEVLEIAVPGFGDEEVNGNRGSDILVAWLGWLLSVLVASVWAGATIPLY